MRKINLHNVFLIAALLLVVGCDKASSQSPNADANKTKDCGAARTAAPIKNYADYEPVGERTNEKYDLNFQITALNNDNWKGFDVAIGKPSTKRCLLYKIAYFDEGLANETPEIFSSDREFTALPCGAENEGYCIYKTAKVAEYFGNASNFRAGKSGGNYCGGGMDTFKTPIEAVDSIKIVDEKGEETLLHKLVGWKGGTVFVFQAKTEQEGQQWREFSYDVAEKKIYGSTEKFGAAKNKQGTVKISQ